ncbi:transposase [Penicillium bovifimosum]|uniref:Transposase n=1 Tax=Penicillium bovifimosum TaxID=126998 RepID=A0A9W9GVR8_9EURO|nr:transposase [Penicillium bovifimosum]KAJ5130960.1 transposase [Penicillium bovifimosum]
MISNPSALNLTQHIFASRSMANLFLSYKQHFRKANNEWSFWAGQPMGKAQFLRVIGPVRRDTFKKRVIRDSFNDRGIYPVDGSKVLNKISNGWDDIPDIDASDLRSYGARTPSPPPAYLPSSSVESTPPKTLEALRKNHAKISRHAELLAPKQQRGLERIFRQEEATFEDNQSYRRTVNQIRGAQEPMWRSKTRRQIKGLSDNGALTIRDANRSIATRKDEEGAAEKRRLAREYQKTYGCKLPDVPTQENEASLEAARVAEENGELFYFDPAPVR